MRKCKKIYAYNKILIPDFYRPCTSIHYQRFPGMMQPVSAIFPFMYSNFYRNQGLKDSSTTIVTNMIA